MSNPTKNNEPAVLMASEIYLGDTLGLKHDHLDHAKGFNSTQCPSCNVALTFRPEQLKWTTVDEPFEYVDAKCSECGREFELTAANAGLRYDFFTD